MYNPDYPTDQGAGFLQHTYQNTPRNDMYFWGGFSGNASGCYNDGSRRNMMNPVNPVAPNPFSQFGQTQSSVPEQAVQPFSSYPPSPMTPNGGLNAAIESRRNIPNQMPNQNNPWAKPAPAMNGYNAAPAAPQAQPMFFDPNPYASYYGPDANTMALYNNNTFSFDKRNSWDNFYTQTRPYPMPAINWREQQQQQNAGMNNCCPTQCMNSYQLQPFPTAPLNWKDKAMENWSYQR